MDKKSAGTTSLEVGQVIYSLNVGNAARRCGQVLTEYFITKVGRKYFWISQKDGGLRDIQFHIDGLTEKSEYCSDHKLYLNKADYYIERHRREMKERIMNVFDRLHRARADDVSTDSLEQICKVLDGEDL